MKKKIFWAIAAIIITGAALGVPIMSNVEQAKYTVIEQQGDIQIREYAPMIIAQASVSGDREAAINQGFQIIADYIFGNNTRAQKAAMTEPVTQQPSSEKIAMTAPVMQKGEGKSGWSASRCHRTTRWKRCQNPLTNRLN